MSGRSLSTWLAILSIAVSTFTLHAAGDDALTPGSSPPIETGEPVARSSPAAIMKRDDGFGPAPTGLVTNFTYDNASKGFLTDGAWMLQFGLARIGGSGYPTVVTMRGHDDILCKTQGWHFFDFGGKDSWSHSESSADYGYGGYTAGLAEGNNWLFGSGSHHTNGNGNFHVIGAGGGDYSNGLATPEPMYWGYGPAFGDFDSDGVVDVVANANPWSGSNTTSSTFVWRGPAGKWSLDQIIDKQWNVQHGMKFVDFDRDGFLDLASSNDILREPGHFIWRYNSEISKFEPWVNDLDQEMRSEPFDVGDLNADGLPDVVLVRQYKQGQGWMSDLEAYLQVPDAPGKFVSSSTGLPKDTAVAHLRAYDMDADGDLDIAATETIPKGGGYASRLAVWLNDGDAVWTRAPVTIQGNILAQADWLEVDDIDNNGLGDFVFPENWGDCSEGGGFRAYKESTAVADPKAWVDEPWGGERWFPDSIRYIRWRSAFPAGSSCSGSTKLEYSVTGPSGPWKKIDDMLACAGTYAWKVPKDPSKNVFVRAAVKTKAGDVQGLSGGGTVPFEIIGGSAVPLRASVVTPAGGESWDVGTQQKIAWTVSGGQSPYLTDVEYSVSGASGPWKPVAGAQTGSDYAWTIPDDPSITALVQITAKDSSSPQQSAVGVSGQFAIRRQPAPMTATLKAMPDAVGPGGRSILTLELSSGRAKVEGATVSMSADSGGIVSPASDKGGGVYEAELTAPDVAAKTTVTIAANASRPGFLEASTSAQVAVSPNLPDLLVDGGKVASPAGLVEGDVARLSARVLNSGLRDAAAFSVRILVDGKPLASAEVEGLAAGANRDVSWEWTSVKGKHEIKVAVDPDSKVAEADESNNLASSSVDVAARVRQFELPWWLLLLIVAVVAGLVAAAALSKRRRRPCRWCGARHPEGASCLPSWAR